MKLPTDKSIRNAMRSYKVLVNGEEFGGYYSGYEAAVTKVVG